MPIYDTKRDLKKGLPRCLHLPGRTTSSESVGALSEYFQAEALGCGECTGVSTNSSESMIRQHSGGVARIKAVAFLKMLSRRCRIHQQHLVAKKLSPELTQG